MITIKCECLFDITATGVTGHFRESLLPFVDKSGASIKTEMNWFRARNQQRNLETLIQLISLREQIIENTIPVFEDGKWIFEVTVESGAALGDGGDPLCILKSDATGVPIILGLTEKTKCATQLIPTGENTNVWFTPLLINT